MRSWNEIGGDGYFIAQWRWRNKDHDKMASCPGFCAVSWWLDAPQSSLVLKSGLNANWSKRYQTIITIRLMYTCSRPEENSIRPGCVCTVAPIQVSPQQLLFSHSLMNEDTMSPGLEVFSPLTVHRSECPPVELVLKCLLRRTRQPWSFFSHQQWRPWATPSCPDTCVYLHCCVFDCGMGVRWRGGLISRWIVGHVLRCENKPHVFSLICLLNLLLLES